jgi:hypothetical protein
MTGGGVEEPAPPELEFAATLTPGSNPEVFGPPPVAGVSPESDD